MDSASIKRTPENVAGDFYVEADLCILCCLPHGEAPDLLNDCTRDFRECYFRRQPETPEEVEQAIQAIHVSCMCALRYGGADQTIISRLRDLDCAERCDHESVGPRSAAASKPWWRRLFGGAGKPK